MPHMQRLTWTGVAMHAGNLPGYPASAGCVRLPVDFAANLYSVTTIGTTVIIADHNSAPKETVKPGLLFSAKTGTTAGGFKWTPESKIGRSPVSGVERLSGSYVFTALQSLDPSGDASGFRWPVADAGRRI
jgi:hypothetical protein